MKSLFVWCCMLGFVLCQIVMSAIVGHVLVSNTTGHRNTTPTLPPDKPVYHGLYFYYHKWSFEHLLLAMSFKDCFLMPLYEGDVEDILDPIKLRKMEEHMIVQIAQHNFMTWTWDDYEVRDGAWSDTCKKKNGSIYRVYRV